LLSRLRNTLMSRESQPPNIQNILKVFAQHQIEYMLIGGMAAITYGSHQVTWDIDVLTKVEDQNLNGLVYALNALEAKQIIRDEIHNVEITLDLLKHLPYSRWQTNSGDVDILHRLLNSGLNGAETFEELKTSSNKMTSYGITFLVAGLDDIIESKIKTGRPQDLATVENLLQLKRHREADNK